MRKTLLTALVVGLAFVCLGVSACVDAPLEPEAAALLAGPSMAMSGNGAVEWVTGNAHYKLPVRDAAVTFNIVKFADGRVTGWYQAVQLGKGGAHIKVRMECLHIVGNQAWATGTVVAAAGPGNIGKPYSFRFVDNGEGLGSAPDEFGAARFEYYDCMTEPDLPMRQLEFGNLQVRG